MLLSYRRREGCIVCARRSCWLRFQEWLCKPLGLSARGDEGSSRRGISPRSCLNVFPRGRGHRAGAEGISVEVLLASRQGLSDGSAVCVCTSARAHKHKHIFIFTITGLKNEDCQFRCLSSLKNIKNGTVDIVDTSSFYCSFALQPGSAAALWFFLRRKNVLNILTRSTWW